MGLEFATTSDWPFWGPDVVWSYTRLAGGLQSLLIGIPLMITDNIRSPLLISNLITASGLVVLALYANHRLKNLPLPLLLALFSLLPFTFYNGVVLLNTAYLIGIGVILFISVQELFSYRNDTILKNISLYFMALGLCLTLTFQLHLTWVMIVPFILFLLYQEFSVIPGSIFRNLAYLIIGVLIGGSTLWPTVIAHGDMIFFNTSNNLTFDPTRVAKIGDLFVKYAGMASFDITQTFEIYQLARDKSLLSKVLIWLMKFIGAIQFCLIIIYSFKLRKEEQMKKSLILFGLTMLMALGLFVMGNKHLSARTYILLFAIPFWVSIQVYSYLLSTWPKLIYGFYAALLVAFVTYSSVAYENAGDRYSFSSHEEIIESALEIKDASILGKRRINYMDGTRLRPPE